jgi:hypothetical protein
MSTSGDAASTPDRDSPLIEAVPIDDLLARFREWATADDRYGQVIAQIDDEVGRLRLTLKTARASPAEEPGRTQVDDPAVAVRMVKVAKDMFTAAGEACRRAQAELGRVRSEAAAAVVAAQVEAEAALAQAQDVVLARRVVPVLAIVLAAILAKVMGIV